MKKSSGICLLTCISIRKEPSHASEMVSQLLFGETYDVVDETEEWFNILCSLDAYQGWISKKQYSELKSPDFELTYLTSRIGIVEVDKQEIVISAGASLPIFKHNITPGCNIQLLTGSSASPKKSADDLVQYAHLFLHAPYLWGGRSLFGIDCSGFTQVIYKFMGIALPRDAYQQAEIGQTVAFIEEAQCGDLAFFDNELGKITHVGILLDNKTIIHASGKVRMDRMDHQGIYAVDQKGYSHTLRLIKRVIF